MPKRSPRKCRISFLISATGGDSTLALYDQLLAIAPTLVISMTMKAGRVLLTQLGGSPVRRNRPPRDKRRFEAQLTTVKQRIALPPQPVQRAGVYPAAHSANLWTARESAQGKLLTQLGFYAGDIAPGRKPAKRGKRHDIIQLGGENLVTG